MNIATESKRTLIVSLHAVELARRYFPRVVALRRGRVAFDVSANQFDRKILGEFFQDELPGGEGGRPRNDVSEWGKLHCAR